MIIGFWSNSFFTRARYYSIPALLAACLAARPASSADSGPAEQRVEAARQLLRDRHPKAKAKLLEAAQNEDDPAARARLVGLLVNLKLGTVSVAELQAFLGDDEPAVRAEAARNLGVHGGSGAREALEGLLLADANAGVRLAAAFWLGGLKSPDSSAALGQALAKDQDSNVRVQAARSLHWLGTSGARDQLKLGQKDQDQRVRGVANEK